MSFTPLDRTVAITRALGHAGRLRTIAMLRSGELCVCQVTEVLGLAPSTVSLHLKELKRAGLIRERRQGRWVFIALSEDAEVRSWIDAALAALRGEPRLEADAEMVEELRRLPVEDLCRIGYEGARAKAAAAGARRVRRPARRTLSRASRRKSR